MEIHRDEGRKVFIITSQEIIEMCNTSKRETLTSKTKNNFKAYEFIFRRLHAWKVYSCVTEVYNHVMIS